MKEKTELQKLGEETWTYFEQYCNVIEPYRNELWRYCLKITGSPWDAEDLYQDTILKLFTSLSALSHRVQPIHPRSFLFRVATNHWIDLCRKRKFVTSEYSDEFNVESSNDVDPIELNEAFGLLLHNLPPRQVAVIVLIDAFKFTASETAEIIGTTEGAVTALLHRARTKLRRMRQDCSGFKTNPENQKLVNEYVSCFNKRDFIGIANLLADNAVYSFVTQNSKEYGKETILKASHHPRHYKRTDLQAFVRELWGEQVVIFAVISGNENPSMLNNVLTFEIEDDKIININCYYFCPNIMEAAAKEIGLPREHWNWEG